MYLIDKFSQFLRCEVELHFINTWDIKYPLSLSFYVRTCVKFAFANKIEAMYERSHVQLCKSKSRNSLNLTFNLNTLYLTSILYPRTLLAARHVHRIEIPYRAFPKRVGQRILSLESVDCFRTTDHFSGRKKKNDINQQKFKVYWKIRIEDRGSRN